MLTVTTAATDLNLLSDSELRLAIGVASGQTAEIAALNKKVASVITAACKVAETGVVPPTLRQETLTDTYRLKSSQNALVLSRRPILSMTTVIVNDTLLDGSVDYEIEASAGMLRRLSGSAFTYWPVGKIVAVYSAGWETVPEDLKEAAAKMARVLWSEGAKTDPNLKRESIPGIIDREWWVSQNDDRAIPQEVLDLLKPYMNHYIG